AQIINGTHFGKKVIIPRLRITPSDKHLQIKIVRKQYPLSLSFAMKINRAKVNPRFSKVGLYCHVQFSQSGQFMWLLALSRVKSKRDSLTLNQSNRFQAGKKKKKIPLSFCTPSLEAGLSVRKWPGSCTCLSNSYVERPEVPSTGPETECPIRNVHRRFMAIESDMSIIVVFSMHIISQLDHKPDDTCRAISIIFNRFRNMGVNNTANTCGGSHEMLPADAKSKRVGRNVWRWLTTTESVMFGNVGRLPTAANASVLKPREDVRAAGNNQTRINTVQKTTAGSVKTLPTADEQHPNTTYITRNLDMAEGGGVPIIRNPDMTDGTSLVLLVQDSAAAEELRKYSKLLVLLVIVSTAITLTQSDPELYLQYKMSGEEPTPQMALVETPQMVSVVKLLILKKGEYTLWSIRMEQYLTNTDYGLWQVIMNGDEPIQTTKDENGVETKVPPKTAQAILTRQKERKAKSILSGSDTEDTTCSKNSVKTYEKLQKQFDEQRQTLSKANLEIIAYQLGLESVEAQLVIHQKNKAVYEEKIALLEVEGKDKGTAVTRLYKSS
ncbi:hypothetical protein Tco_0689927, partial [Tanacetum coccineum]